MLAFHYLQTKAPLNGFTKVKRGTQDYNDMDLQADVGELEPVQPLAVLTTLLLLLRGGPARDHRRLAVRAPLRRTPVMRSRGGEVIELPSSPRPREHAVQGEGGPRGDHQLPAPPRHPATPRHGVVQRRRQGLCRM